MCASVVYMDVNLCPAKHLRDELIRQLRTVKEVAQFAATHDKSDVSEQALPEVPATLPKYWFEQFSEFWAIRFEDEIGIFGDNKGMQYIARLLARPFARISAPELARSIVDSVDNGSSPKSIENLAYDDEDEMSAGDSDLPILDDQAKAEYKRKLEQLKEEIDTATKLGEDNKVEELRRDFAMIAEQIQAATGLGGRDRQLGPSPAAKKAFESVGKAITRAYERMEKGPRPLIKLVTHLSANIHSESTGYIYRAYPTLSWKL